MNSQIPSAIAILDKLVFKLCGFTISKLKAEKESQEYGAHEFLLLDRKIKFRSSKITPTKIGQFVTLWKWNSSGITEPYSIFDDFDFYLISARKEELFGVFIFPKTVLLEKGILSDEKTAGKRGFRVYPSWDLPTSKQALKNQEWQDKYFLEISEDKKIDLERAKFLLIL